MRGGCFSIRLALGVAVGTIALIVLGINGLLEGARFREAKVLTYEQFAQQKPTEGWFRITNCVLDVLNESHMEKEGHKDDLGSVNEVYLPVRSLSDNLAESDKQPILLLVATRDKAVLDDIKSLGDEIKTAQNVDDFMKKNVNRLFVHRDVEGKIKAGINSEDSKTVSELRKVNGNLAADAVILEEGAKPSPGTGAAMLLGGIVLAIGQVVFYVMRFANRS